MVIVDDSISDDIYKEYQKKWESILFKENDLIQKLDWGVKHLATPIQKKTQARYLVYLFASNSENISEFQKSIRYDKNVLRHLVLQKSENVDVEERRQEIIEKAKKAQEEREERQSSEKISSDAIAERRKAAMENASKS
jgi:small subunit ribosomal protein S6